MGIQTAERPTVNHSLGALVTEGKTKKIHQIDGSSDLVTVVAKDDITAGDGAKHDIIPDKGRLATATTCNVFRLLKACGLPVAFDEQDSATSFIAPHCHMLPYEVVVRREAHGSYLKRNPHFGKGQLFPQLIVEFYLKTKDKNWKGKPLVCDDPLMQLRGRRRADQAVQSGQADAGAGAVSGARRPRRCSAATTSGRSFPRCGASHGRPSWCWRRPGSSKAARSSTLKVEFGFDAKGSLLLADVIDNNSWRVIESGAYIDKQVYRDGGALDDVAAKYRHVAEITGHFRVPRQRIILWRGSENDKTDAFTDALGELEGHDDGGDLLGAQGAGGRRRHPASHDPGDAGHGGDRLYRPLERRRPDAVGDVDDSRHHRAGQRQGVSRRSSGRRCARRARFRS